MARTYRLTPLRRLGNLFIRLFITVGFGPAHHYMLSVLGRRSNRIYSTPVRLIENGVRYLVSPYGEVGWVKNARATGTVTLSRGGRSQTVQVVEVSPLEAAPVLRDYLTGVPIARPFFDVRRDSPIEAFVAEASRHPVFRIIES